MSEIHVSEFGLWIDSVRSSSFGWVSYISHGGYSMNSTCDYAWKSMFTPYSVPLVYCLALFGVSSDGALPITTTMDYIRLQAKIEVYRVSRLSLPWCRISNGSPRMGKSSYEPCWSVWLRIKIERIHVYPVAGSCGRWFGSVVDQFIIWM